MNRSGCCLRHLSQKYKCQLGPSSNVIWNHQSSCVPFIPFILSKTSYFKSPFLLLIPILLAQWPGRNHWFHSSHCHGRPGSFWSLQYLWPIYDTIRVFLNLFDSQIRGQICKLFQPPNAVDDLNQVIEEVLESIGFISCSREFWKMVLKFDEICGDPNIIHHFYNKSDVCVVWKEVYTPNLTVNHHDVHQKSAVLWGTKYHFAAGTSYHHEVGFTSPFLLVKFHRSH
jgi:hypothetical protein